MQNDDDKDLTPLRVEVDAIRNDLESGMHGLRKRQRAAIEKARAAVDRKKIEKIRRSLGASGS